MPVVAVLVALVDAVLCLYGFVVVQIQIQVSYDVMCCFFQAEDGIRDLVRSRGLGDVYKRQAIGTHDPLAGQHDLHGGIANEELGHRALDAAVASLSLIHI